MLVACYQIYSRRRSRHIGAVARRISCKRTCGSARPFPRHSRKGNRMTLTSLADTTRSILGKTNSLWIFLAWWHRLLGILPGVCVITQKEATAAVAHGTRCHLSAAEIANVSRRNLQRKYWRDYRRLRLGKAGIVVLPFWSTRQQKADGADPPAFVVADFFPFVFHLNHTRRYQTFS